LNPRTFDKQTFAIQIKQIKKLEKSPNIAPPDQRTDQVRSSLNIPSPDDIPLPWEAQSTDSDQDMSDQEEDALALEDDEKLLVEISHMDRVDGDPYRYRGRSGESGSLSVSIVKSISFADNFDGRSALSRLAIIGMARAPQNGLTSTRQTRNPAYWSTTPWQKQ
jgi:hypothetical protein